MSLYYKSPFSVTQKTGLIQVPSSRAFSLWVCTHIHKAWIKTFLNYTVYSETSKFKSGEQHAPEGKRHAVSLQWQGPADREPLCMYPSMPCELHGLPEIVEHSQVPGPTQIGWLPQRTMTLGSPFLPIVAPPPILPRGCHKKPGANVYPFHRFHRQ